MFNYGGRALNDLGAPLVEGLIAGVAVNDEKADIESVLDELKELKTFSKLTY